MNGSVNPDQSIIGLRGVTPFRRLRQTYKCINRFKNESFHGYVPL